MRPKELKDGRWVFGDETGRDPLWLTREAMSGSGKAVKGAHVLDPRTARPSETESRTWARAPSAALADALSTAFMVFSRKRSTIIVANTQVLLPTANNFTESGNSYLVPPLTFFSFGKP